MLFFIQKIGLISISVSETVDFMQLLDDTAISELKSSGSSLGLARA